LTTGPAVTPETRAASAVVTGTGAARKVTGIIINNPGAGYTSAPTVTFSAATGGTLPVTATAGAVTLTTIAPTVSFTAPPTGGTAATGTVNFNTATGQVTGITLSPSQLAYAHERLGAQSMHADLRLQDYRDTNDGPYDAICSIEMIEAVGRAYWPTYFQTIARLLKPGGQACIQSIVIDDALFERYALGTDFIQQYIFPGGFLPSTSQFKAQAQAAGLQVVDSFAFGQDYAETLKRWRETYMQTLPHMGTLGFDQRFERTWLFYLAYCEAAFLERNTDVVQFTLRKPA
jgi:cyclopropane-fatty-acyl-phospholipid synthase